MTDPGIVPDPPAAPEASISAMTANRGRWWLPLLRVVPGGVASGILVGVGWTVLAPVVARWAGAAEDAAARDVTFGLLGVLAGLLTAAALVVGSGASPAVHTALVLAVATGASVLAWGVGELLGAHPLHAIALVVVWPLVAAAMTVVRSLVAVLLGPP